MRCSGAQGPVTFRTLLQRRPMLLGEGPTIQKGPWWLMLNCWKGNSILTRSSDLDRIGLRRNQSTKPTVTLKCNVGSNMAKSQDLIGYSTSGWYGQQNWLKITPITVVIHGVLTWNFRHCLLSGYEICLLYFEMHKFFSTKLISSSTSSSSSLIVRHYALFIRYYRSLVLNPYSTMHALPFTQL